jgi:hypothetical protein
MTNDVNVVDPRDRGGFRARVVVARKAFTCSFCKHQVAAGESYGRTRDWHSSRFYDFKVCRAHWREEN